MHATSLTKNGKARGIASIDKALRSDAMQEVIVAYGRGIAVAALRQAQAAARAMVEADVRKDPPDIVSLADSIARSWMTPSLKALFNLTGTILHTNLGRAILPCEAMHDMLAVALEPSNLEYDLGEGRRGDRDLHIEALVRQLTGAEAATIVNNNAAALLLVLNTLALNRDVPISRGELIEIGDSFRLPDLIVRSGGKLVEIGTTNRTHLRDYADAIGPNVGVLLKIHTSNYEIRGFTKSVAVVQLAELAVEAGLPLVVDLGSGTLVNLSKYGLPHEQTPQEVLKAGADIVTFSGDKLLGGPQSGLIVGQKHLIDRIKRNPLKRALRVDKLTVAALSAVLRMYLTQEELTRKLPTLRALTRPVDDIRQMAERLAVPLRAAIGPGSDITVESCCSQIGSGALPTNYLPSCALSIRPVARKDASKQLERWVAALRNLPKPVIGRISAGALLLDLRCLEREKEFVDQLAMFESEP